MILVTFTHQGTCVGPNRLLGISVFTLLLKLNQAYMLYPEYKLVQIPYAFEQKLKTLVCILF